jgi:hypothetical protein
MRLLRPASEDEMVAVFLTAEAASERYAPQIRQILAGSGNRVASSSIPIPAIRRPTRCAGGSWPPTRAYPAGDVFTGMPADVAWHQAALTPADLTTVKYIDYPYWTDFSGGTRLAIDGGPPARSRPDRQPGSRAAFRISRGGKQPG